jgi:hypothetical protein
VQPAVVVLKEFTHGVRGKRCNPDEKKSEKLNAVEIEEAISALAEQSFNAQEFPFAFLEAFGNKPTTIKRLRSGASNRSDLGGVLQTNNIHLVVCPLGEVTKTLGALKASPATAKAKARFIFATDGADLEAEDLTGGETVACAYQDFPDHFGFFLPLAGITTVKQVRESSFDIRATSRLNRLYVELLKDNPDWGTAERRHDMNHFMARLSCEQLVPQRAYHEKREQDLKLLMDKARQGTGGAAISVVAYQGEYTATQEEIREIDATARLKKCSTPANWASTSAIR